MNILKKILGLLFYIVSTLFMVAFVWLLIKDSQGLFTVPDCSSGCILYIPNYPWYVQFPGSLSFVGASTLAWFIGYNIRK
jgi:hypothetical protein